MDGDGHPEIVAVLAGQPAYREGRSLGVWAIHRGILQRVSTIALPDAEDQEDLEIVSVSRVAGRELIRLSYAKRKVRCAYENGKLSVRGDNGERDGETSVGSR